MFIFFTLKTAYILAISVLIAFLYGMIGFGVLTPFIPDQDIMANFFMPSFIVIFGLTLIVIESWWKLGDPEATLFLMFFATKIWGIIIMLIGAYMFFDLIKNNGFTQEIGITMGLTLGFAALLLGIFFLRKYFYQKKHGSLK